MTIKQLIKQLIPTEHDEQVALFQWAEAQSGLYPVLDAMYSIPNQGKRSYGALSYFIAEGFKKGMQDVVLPCANKYYSALYIEMKRSTEKNTKNGGLTPEQIKKKELLRKFGNYTCVCYSSQEAIDVILEYLANRNQHECVLLGKIPNCS